MNHLQTLEFEDLGDTRKLADGDHGAGIFRRGRVAQPGVDHVRTGIPSEPRSG